MFLRCGGIPPRPPETTHGGYNHTPLHAPHNITHDMTFLHLRGTTQTRRINGAFGTHPLTPENKRTNFILDSVMNGMTHILTLKWSNFIMMDIANRETNKKHSYSYMAMNKTVIRFNIKTLKCGGQNFLPLRG